MSVKMAITKKTRDDEYWRGCGGKESPVNSGWDCTATIENSMEDPQKN